MVVFLIPIAVVGYKYWEQRRREEEEERQKQESNATDTAASSCLEETDSDVGSSIASSLPQSPAPADTETSEVVTFQSRQNALLRSWKARASEANASRYTYSEVATSLEAEFSTPQSSSSTPIAEATEASEVFEQKQNALLRSWRARTSETNAALIDEPSVSPDLHDLLDLPPHSNAATEVESSLLWSHLSEESAAVVSPIASS